MQLEDIERLEKLRDAKDRASEQYRRDPYPVTRQAFTIAVERYDRAMLEHGPALLALAREALERRRDES